jgi:hypothetical protein
METLNLKKEGQVNILGINSGFGSNPLKIKTLHKETGNEASELFFITDDNRYILDLQAYSNKVEYAPDITDNIFGSTYFDYILLESNVGQVLKVEDNFNMIISRLTKAGTLAICAKNDIEEKMLESLAPYRKITGDFGKWFIWIS